MSDRETYDRPSYRSAKEELEKSAGRIRVYGIQLDKPDDDATAIWFCGYRADITDYRMGSKRIFHIPTQKIVQRGNVDGFKYETHQVQWFDVDPRTRLLEECFFAFEASGLLEPHTEGDNLTVLERLHRAGDAGALHDFGRAGLAQRLLEGHALDRVVLDHKHAAEVRLAGFRGSVLAAHVGPWRACSARSP